MPLVGIYVFFPRWLHVTIGSVLWFLHWSKTEPLLLVIFGSYFCIGALALMNSIIAVVVECTLSAAKASSDKEEEEKQRADVPRSHKIDGTKQLQKKVMLVKAHANQYMGTVPSTFYLYCNRCQRLEVFLRWRFLFKQSSIFCGEFIPKCFTCSWKKVSQRLNDLTCENSYPPEV